MSDVKEKQNVVNKILAGAGCALLFLFGLTANLNAQDTMSPMPTPVPAPMKSEKPAPPPVLTPVWTNYKNVKIGDTAKEVRTALGKAKIDDKDGFYYELSNHEIAQIRLGADKKVRLLSITYSDKSENVPTYADVFGAPPEKAYQPNAQIYKLVKYPKAGYWVIYSRSAGDKPMVTITMQRMRQTK